MLILNTFKTDRSEQNCFERLPKGSDFPSLIKTGQGRRAKHENSLLGWSYQLLCPNLSIWTPMVKWSMMIHLHLCWSCSFCQGYVGFSKFTSPVTFGALFVFHSQNALTIPIIITIIIVNIIIITTIAMACRHIPTMTKSHHGGEMSVMIKVGMCQCQIPTIHDKLQLFISSHWYVVQLVPSAQMQNSK